jgi:hypothetical protein
MKDSKITKLCGIVGLFTLRALGPKTKAMRSLGWNFIDQMVLGNKICIFVSFILFLLKTNLTPSMIKTNIL